MIDDMGEGHGVTEQDVGHNTDLLVLVGLRRRTASMRTWMAHNTLVVWDDSIMCCRILSQYSLL